MHKVLLVAGLLAFGSASCKKNAKECDELFKQVAMNINAIRAVESTGDREKTEQVADKVRLLNEELSRKMKPLGCFGK